MAPTDHQSSFLNRISLRRNQVTTIIESENHDLDLFSKHVSDRFSDLLPSANLLSLSWFRSLIDIFLCCEEEFKAAIIMGREPSQFGKAPLDRLIPELLERAVKAMDISNAVISGIELVREWQKLAEIAVAALEQRPIGEGQVRRAKKSLNTLLTSMLFEEKENLNHKPTERPWSITHHAPATSAPPKDRTGGSCRSYSWSLAKSWSAAKQIQAMSTNLVMPRGGEQTSLASPVYVMNNVLVFVMWALVAAFPCQERAGLSTHLNFPRQLDWAKNLIALHEKIGEEWNKKEKKGSAGLMEEIHKMERLAKSLVEFADSFKFPMDEEKAELVANQVAELAEVCRVMEEGLGPLQQHVREVFHRLVRSRAEILDIVDHIGKFPTQPTSF